MINLKVFLIKTTIFAMRERVHSFRTHLSPLFLNSDTTPSILRGILASNRHITNMSLQLLETHLARLRKLKPQRALDASQPTTDPSAMRHLLDGVKMEEYPVHDIGCQTWTEEQRVIRGFWRFQMLYDMKRLGKSRLLRWLEADLVVLDDIRLLEFYNMSRPTHMRLEITAHLEFYMLSSLESYMRETYERLIHRTLPISSG
ncbi:hypothetical protein VTL71DRAFT_6234 [Oculimacula yallundae]|uniref:Uncharacterized protein n=1 Tax=Oculimacula yallundae TaxID=86028 RepID=A0ABR4C0G2_9HELO